MRNICRKYRIVGALVLCALCLSSSANAVEKFGKYEKAPVGAIVPKGHLAEFLRRQRDGLTGHREKLGYPFDGTLWSKAISNIHFTEGVYNGAEEDVSGRIAYNALPGAMTKDFRRHQYLSSVNQVACTPFANDSHFNYAESAWRQYRPSHFPQCCTGNINRAMPIFAEYLWMTDAKTGDPVAMLLGPCEYRGERHVLRAGETFAYDTKPEIRLRRDRNWCWIERGPLAFSLAVPNVAKEDRPGDPFSPVSYTASGGWNYAIDADRLDVSGLKVERRAGAYPFETPTLAIRVPVRKILEWQTLDYGRFTPQPPLCAHPTDERGVEIALVPYATTTTRITCFPDCVNRVRLPVVAAYTSGESYPFDPGRPVEGLMMAPQWFGHKVRKGYNYLLVKVGNCTWTGQFRSEWGARLEVFRKR